MFVLVLLTWQTQILRISKSKPNRFEKALRGFFRIKQRYSYEKHNKSCFIRHNSRKRIKVSSIMLTAQQQLFVQALEELNLDQVKQLLADGLNPNFIDHDKGPVISVWSDGLFKWWEEVCELYEAGTGSCDDGTPARLAVHLPIRAALIQGYVTLALWDAEDIYGPLWDAASAPSAAAVQRLLDEKVDPNSKAEG